MLAGIAAAELLDSWAQLLYRTCPLPAHQCCLLILNKTFFGHTQSQTMIASKLGMSYKRLTSDVTGALTDTQMVLACSSLSIAVS